MSILLDALRKSEQQKKLGAAPDIHGAEPISHGPRRPRWVLPAAMAAVILLMLAGTYTVWRTFLQSEQVQPDALTNTGAQTSPQQTAQNGAVAQEASAGVAAQAATSLSAADRVTAGEVASGDSADDPVGAPASRLNTEPRSPVESLTGERPFQPAKIAVAAGTATSNAARASSDSSDTGATRDSSSGFLEKPLASGSPEAKPGNPQDANEPKTVDTRSENGVISYWQLPETMRDQLPQFKITVLVYDEVPANRFIMMGGKRYHVGDMLDGKVRLITILRDRAIFRYEAYRFFVTQR